MTRPFRQLPWLQGSAWMPKSHCADTAEIEPSPETTACETAEAADEILNAPVSTALAAWTLGILALACVILFSLAWLGKLP